VNGLTTAGLGRPDYEKALDQHAAYIDALRSCGVEVVVLDGDERFPDSTFVEDPAVVTDRMAVIARPGAPSRQGEEAAIAEALGRFFPRLEQIQAPGTLEGGDVLKAGDHFFIGLSARTNPDGAAQLAAVLETHGYTASTVTLRDVLHLKTGLATLERNDLLAAGEFVGHPDFRRFRIIPIDEDESYAANSLWVNGTILVPAGFGRTRRALENLGYVVRAVDVSEFRKLDGGLSCLSLRF
jgi:dimethylargininase